MAYIRKTTGGRWRVEVEKLGIRDSDTFDTKREAENWGATREAEILAGRRGVFPRKTLGAVMDEYVERFSSKKGGSRWEELRVALFKREFPWLAGKVMCDTTTADWARWRDERLKGTATLKGVSGSTVIREIHLWSAIYHKARKELGPYCAASPLTDLDKPRANPLREARWDRGLIKKVVRRLGYRTGQPPQDKQQEVAYAILVALRTAMRCQEVLSLSDENTNLTTRVAVVNHKMQYCTGAPRKVPMQPQAAKLLKPLAGKGRYFSMSPSQLDGLWRKHRDQMLVTGITFHDTRAEAITRLSRKVDVLRLSAITGIKDLKLLNERYYRESAEDIAASL